MKINQPTKHPAGDDTPTSEMTDSPRNYAHRRKTRGARKHAGEMPARVSTLRDTLKAQGLAGKQDSAEAYAALFASRCQSFNEAFGAGRSLAARGLRR